MLDPFYFDKMKFVKEVKPGTIKLIANKLLHKWEQRKIQVHEDLQEEKRAFELYWQEKKQGFEQ